MAIRLTGLASGLDTDSMVKELVSAYSTKLESYEKDKTKLEWTQEKWKDLNTKTYSFYTGKLSSMRMATSFTSKRNVTVSDTTKATVTAGSSAANGSQTITVNEVARSAYLTGGKISTLAGDKVNSGTKLEQLGIATGTTGTFKVTVGGEEKTVNYDASKTVGEFLEELKSATGLSASFDTNQQRFIIHAEPGEDNEFNFDESNSDLAKLGLTTSDDQAVKQTAKNASVTVNGATFISSSNTITVGGLTINALAEGTVSVNVSTDKDGVYNLVKDFLSDYNSLINEMTADYKAESAKDYKPLTDEEKDSMSDEEVEKWEKKIKDSLLRRDETLNSIMSAMKSAMQKGVEINGKTYHLSDFGIGTLTYGSAAENEENAYHINGDSSDTKTADSTDKLKALIDSDPELVQDFFNGLAKNLYSTMTTKMSSTTLSSAYTIYNDKDLDNQKKELEKTIKSWEKKVSDYEDTWFDKFSKMETALTKLQQQTSQLASLLGGSTS